MGDQTTLTISGVAMCMAEATAQVLSLPAPARHHDLIRHTLALGHSRGAVAAARQGFTSSDGQFRTRQDARRIALAAGQAREPTTHERELFSEDVW